MINISESHIQKLAPNAKSHYREAFKNADGVLSQFGINQSPLRLAHFMAQVLHETGGLTIYIESMNYSAKRLCVVWPSRFPTLESATPYAHNGRKLANKVYNGRMGNRHDTDDGWNYIGRGLLQMTGREDYAGYGNLLGVDLISTPDLAFDKDHTLRIAALEWNKKACNPHADQDNLSKVTRLINGGQIGIAQRKEWLAKTKNIWH